MKAVFQTGYGNPNAFELKTTGIPTIKKLSDVLLRVHAAALHVGDIWMMRAKIVLTIEPPDSAGA